MSKIGAYEANSTLQKKFRDFSQRGYFSDFIDTRLSNYIPSGIQIRFPIFWVFFLIRFKPHQEVEEDLALSKFSAVFLPHDCRWGFRCYHHLVYVCFSCLSFRSRNFRWRSIFVPVGFSKWKSSICDAYPGGNYDHRP